MTDMAEYVRSVDARHWADVIARAADPRSVRIAGKAYWLGDEGAKGGDRGFYGDRFRIRFADGRVVDTTNMWHQGDVPADLRRGALADNATFVTA